ERAELARRTPPGQREGDLAAGIRFLRQQPYVRGDRVGAIGWCMGGSFAFRLALEDSLLQAAILHYPTEDDVRAAPSKTCVAPDGGYAEARFARAERAGAPGRLKRRLSFTPRRRRAPAQRQSAFC